MRTALFAACAALALAGVASAQESLPQASEPEIAAAGPSSPFDVSFNLAVTSDYVYRGISQTNEDAALQGGVDVTAGSFYAGAWASNVDFGDDTHAEVDVYAGYKPQVAGWTLDLGLIYYEYLGQPSNANWQYVEAKAAASRSFGGLTLGGALFYSPEFTGDTGTALYSELNAGYAITPSITVNGAVGRQDIEAGGDYTTWNLGALVTVMKGVALDVRYWDTDLDGSPLADERIAVTAKVAF